MMDVQLVVPGSGRRRSSSRLCGLTGKGRQVELLMAMDTISDEIMQGGCKEVFGVLKINKKQKIKKKQKR